MSNWLNRNTGEIVVAGFVLLIGAAFTSVYQLGRGNEKLDRISIAVKENGDAVAALRIQMNDGLDQLSQRVDARQSDLRSILVSTGTLGRDDTFYAAVIKDDIWVFPNEGLRAELLTKGYTAEQATSFLTGFKMLPASAVQ
ncbi:hypothetical protein [Anianabacter salinae]|uniref:hypothetical protein n=1 Tax=Anianabacter salinae TaxID=2851023 RepID=UPI00225E3E80|nr:hypothetical protein [Anianabacter salinae]MBV0913303.1 hypothetical protein [Anianabacter salinae]